MILYKSIGTIRYGYTHLVVDADTEITRYYRALMPKYIKTNPQMHPAHISVVRKETIPNMNLWRQHEGEKVEFYYSPIIHEGSVYFWLNVFCLRLEEIREELGLLVHSPYITPPENYKQTFHITLGNKK